MTEEPKTLRRQVRRVGQPRGVRHVVKVSAEQEARLVEVANAQGVTVPRLLVESALSGGPGEAAARRAVAGELFGLQRALGAIGVNLNQLARSANSTGYLEESTAASLQRLDLIVAQVGEFLGRARGVV